MNVQWHFTSILDLYWALRKRTYSCPLARQDGAGAEEGDGAAEAAHPAQARECCGEGGGGHARLRGGGSQRAARPPAHRRRQRRQEEPLCHGEQKILVRRVRSSFGTDVFTLSMTTTKLTSIYVVYLWNSECKF